MPKIKEQKIYLAILVAALGYFVDVFDIAIFSIVRIPSLQALGLSGDEIISTGVFLLNCQMAGMLLGGLVWGILGDKIGRLQILFGSIFVYSTATLLNAFVETIPQYAILRFISGFGLSGEIGAGITLVSELMPKEKRGLGTTIVATVGVFGAVVASSVAGLISWQNLYILGGVMGFCLLFLRISVHESGMFNHVKCAQEIKKGDLSLFFTDKSRLRKFFACVLVGFPVWYANGVLVAFSPEIASALGISGITNAKAMTYFITGAVIGDFASGVISQITKNRIFVLRFFIFFAAFFSFFTLNFSSTYSTFLIIFGICGFFIGYWAVFISTAAEQFGTNLRATVAVSIPNFVRGSTLITVTLFNYLREPFGLLQSAEIVGAGCFAVSLIALTFLKETYGVDLNFIEEVKGTKLLQATNQDDIAKQNSTTI